MEEIITDLIDVINKNENKGETILVIDDSPSIIDYLISVLKPNGYRILIAKNGRTGISRARKDNPDLIILDVLMPEENGYDVCRSLKASKDTCNIPILFFTSLQSDLDTSKAFSLGAADYVTKNSSTLELFSRIKAHLAVHELEKVREREAQKLEELVNIRTKELQEALKDRNTYLKEINHRVKNNLQLINAIIDQQCIQTKNQESLELLDRLKGRLQTFSFAYNHLWSNKKLDGISMKEYLSSISNDTLVNRKKKFIILKSEIEDIVFPIDSALPCGFILHELLSNVVNHAYEKEGSVYVSLSKEDEKCVLTVNDNGCGWANKGIPEDRLGLHFVRILSEQLNGKLTIDGSNGTKVYLEFPTPIVPIMKFTD